MFAILGGLGAASAFAAATLCSSRSIRILGPSSVLAWVMLVGLMVTGPFAVRDGIPAQLTAAQLGWLAFTGCGNVLGLLLAYAGLRLGRVGIAIAAVLASQFGALAGVVAYLLFRERLARVQLAGVTAIVVGVGTLSVLQA